MIGWDEPPTYGIEDPQDVPPLCFYATATTEIYPTDPFYTDAPGSPGSKGSVDLHEDCLMDWVRELGGDVVAGSFGFVKRA